MTLLGVITVGVLLQASSWPWASRSSNFWPARRTPTMRSLADSRIDGYRNISGHPDAVTIPGVVLYRFDASVLFFNADYFKARVRTVVDAAQPKPRWLVIDAGTIAYVDVTGAAVLKEVFEDLTRAGITVAMADVKGPVRAMLERTGLSQQIGNARMFPTMESAVAEITNLTTARSSHSQG